MDYREFVDQVAKDLEDMLSEKFQGADITARQIDKLQGESYYGISVQPEGFDIGVSINIDNNYMKYQNGVAYDEVVRDVATAVEKGMINQPNVIMSELMNYDCMKEKLMIQVVPTKGNEKLLSGMPHMEWEDMSLVYRFVFDTNGQGMASCVVNHNLLRTYDITADQLHVDAMDNAPKQFPVSIRSLRKVLAEEIGCEMLDLEDTGMFVATCNRGVNGAGCIFYSEFMDQAAKIVQGDFFIVPSSVHEVLLCPDNGKIDYHELEALVQEVNENEVLPQDRLTDSVYHYDSQDRIFEKAERFDERMQKKLAKEKESLKARLDAKKKEVVGFDGSKKSSYKVQNVEL